MKESQTLFFSSLELELVSSPRLPFSLLFVLPSSRLPSFIASKSTSDPTPTHANPNPLVSRVFDTTIQLYSETSLPSPSSSSSASSTPPPSPKAKSFASTSENIHGVEFYTAGIDGTKATTGGTVNVFVL